ncbi:MAG: effector binding domain-containing protein [Defluviitaleaceae bacterium]|nr:effector binding domain-containing protein [Defluviitaleaceae bacterium]
MGFADGSSYDGESFIYYIATPYEGETVPEGFLVKDIPARTWVKFRCFSFGDGKSTADEDIYKKIYSEYFPASEYEPAEYQMEVYPRGDGDYPDEVSEVWVAVKKKSKH